MRQYELKCMGTFWLDFSTSLCINIALMLVIIISAICYRYRVFIEYLYLIVISSRRKYGSVKDTYEYDGFISYSTKDTHWVTNVLFRKLSGDINMNICIYDKDFIPGRSIATEILRRIDQSRNIIFVVTC